jgi:hypothetical protein
MAACSGRSATTGNWWTSSRCRFERAIAEDPDYALAYAGLSDSYALHMDYRNVPVREALERPKEYARRAVALAQSGDLGLDERKRPLEFVERAYQERRGSLVHRRVNEIFDPLRGEPRFEAVARRMKL